MKILFLILAISAAQAQETTSPNLPDLINPQKNIQCAAKGASAHFLVPSQWRISGNQYEIKIHHHWYQVSPEDIVEVQGLIPSYPIVFYDSTFDSSKTEEIGHDPEIICFIKPGATK